MKPIAFLGPRGTFSEDAAIRYAGPEANLQAFGSIPALTEAVETGLAAAAILPIENSIEGSVSATLDLLIHETPLKISAEVVVPVRHFLVTSPGVKLSDIEIITSHPQGLGQSRQFLERCLPNAQQIAHLSTAGAVKEVAESGDPHRAAIGPARAADLYGGEILAHDIQDLHSNVTRFVVLTERDAPPSGCDRTSIGFTVEADVPGALYQAMTPLARKSIQLTKIESRPTKAWLGEYVFLIDFEGHRLDAHIVPVLEELNQLCNVLKVFGSYPRFPVDEVSAMFDSSIGISKSS